MPMYEKLKFPASAMMVTVELINIATFDVIPTESIDSALWYFPEEEAFSLNFETAGVESQTFLQNIGLILYLIMLNILCGILYFLLLPARNSASCLSKVVTKMKKYLLFNGNIRFYMELFLDVGLLASLNMHTVGWSSSFTSTQVSNYLSIAMLILICIWPLCFILLACCKPKIWQEEKFKDRCGTILEDTDLRK